MQHSSGLHRLKKYQLNQFVTVRVIDVSDSTIATLAGRDSPFSSTAFDDSIL